MYVRTKMLKPLTIRHFNQSRMDHFSAALSQALVEEWPSSYAMPKVKGHTPQTWQQHLTRLVSNGGLRTIRLDDPAVKKVCHKLSIPNTYKGIEQYLRSLS